MRVLGHAWSVANAPSGTLPKTVVRTSRTVVTQTALALAEAGLRVTLGQPPLEAVRDIGVDFWAGLSFDPGSTGPARDAGRRRLRAGDRPGSRRVRGRLRPAGVRAGAGAGAASGPDFVSFAVSASGRRPADLLLTAPQAETFSASRRSAGGGAHRGLVPSATPA
jgi:hypothetical protein